jgi:beta-glucanase (GH16 family)
MKIEHAINRAALTATLIIVAGLAVVSSGLSATGQLGHPASSYDRRPQKALPGSRSEVAEADSPGSLLDHSSLIETFDDEFNEFSWYADGVIDGKQGGGTWRTHFGYAGVQDRGSRTLSSNGEQQIYVDRAFRGTTNAPLGLDPFRIANGVLEITADRASEKVRPYIWNYPYISGLITTRGTFAQQYGVFEVRARIPKGRGLWSCVWLLPSRGGWPPEIDIMEVLGNQPTTLVTTWHSIASGTHTVGPVGTDIPDASADFHIYTVDWDESQIRWYFDGAEVSRAPTPADMHTPMYLLLNLAVGGYWPGSPDSNTQFPAALAIDWVRVYKRTDASTK